MKNHMMRIREELLNTIFPYKKNIFCAHMLFAAADLNIISHCLHKERTLNEIAKFTKLDPNKAYLLIESLRMMSIFQKNKAGYNVSPDIKKLFIKNDPNYIGHTIDIFKADWQRIYNVRQFFSPSSADRSIKRNEKETEIYLSSISKFNSEWMDVILRASSELLRGKKEIVDIGGGHGKYAEKILNKYRGNIVTIFDLENAIRYCKRVHRGTKHFKRMRFIKGDILKTNITQKYDVVMIHDLLHYFPLKEKAFIIKKSYNSIRVNGHLIISKFHLTETKKGLKPDFSLIFAIKNFIHTSNGYLETDEETVRILKGLGSIKVQKMTDKRLNKTLLIVKKLT